MKKDTLKALKKASRKQIPVGRMREKVIPSKKKKILEKEMEKEAGEDSPHQ
jgi:hypothetical protein